MQKIGWHGHYEINDKGDRFDKKDKQHGKSRSVPSDIEWPEKDIFVRAIWQKDIKGEPRIFVSVNQQSYLSINFPALSHWTSHQKEKHHTQADTSAIIVNLCDFCDLSESAADVWLRVLDEAKQCERNQLAPTQLLAS